MPTARISLDNPVFTGRLRTSRREPVYERRVVARVRPRLVQDIRTTAKANTQKTAPKVQLSAVLTSAKARVVVTPHSRPAKSHVLKRSTVHAPVPKRQPRSRISSKKVLLGLAAMLFLFGIGVGIDGLRANSEVVAQVQSIQQSVASVNTDVTDENAPAPVIPDEADKPSLDAYQVAADLPRALYIPKLNVEARVLHLGVTRNGAVASPSNILDTGWFKESAKPGQAGAVLIDGHVHGPTKPGVFVNLKKLKAGDEIQLERGDGTRLTYKVVETKTYPADNVDMGAALRPAGANKQGLNLITCTGEIDKATNQYKDRLVVFAVHK